MYHRPFLPLLLFPSLFFVLNPSFSGLFPVQLINLSSFLLIVVHAIACSRITLIYNYPVYSTHIDKEKRKEREREREKDMKLN